MSRDYFRRGRWYMISAETAGTINPKVIVTEFSVRQRSLRRNEEAELPPPGPALQELFEFLVRNRATLDLHFPDDGK